MVALSRYGQRDSRLRRHYSCGNEAEHSSIGTIRQSSTSREQEELAHSYSMTSCILLSLTSSNRRSPLKHHSHPVNDKKEPIW